MKSRPILFSAPMVRALLDGRKTQTRRTVKITHRTPGLAACLEPFDPAWVRPHVAVELCPYGKPGDLLWVRETFAGRKNIPLGNSPLWYRADGETRTMQRPLSYYDDRDKWRPSIYMPRWASRLTLRITEVRVQRLHDISEDDALAEGVDAISQADVPRNAAWSQRQDFSRLWESINGPGSWDANPWVWALTFEVIKRNVDTVIQESVR